MNETGNAKHLVNLESLVDVSTNQLAHTRLTRNQSRYDDTNGLAKTAPDIKRYLKSVFGATGPQYKQISGLKLTRQKNDNSPML